MRPGDLWCIFVLITELLVIPIILKLSAKGVANFCGVKFL